MIVSVKGQSVAWTLLTTAGQYHPFILFFSYILSCLFYILI